MRAAEHFVTARDPKTLTVRQVMENDVCAVSPDTKGIDIPLTEEASTNSQAVR